MTITRFLRTSVVGEMTMLAAAAIFLAGLPERAYPQENCYIDCGQGYEDYETMCEALYRAGDYYGYALCLEAADENYNICLEGCFF